MLMELRDKEKNRSKSRSISAKKVSTISTVSNLSNLSNLTRTPKSRAALKNFEITP